MTLARDVMTSSPKTVPPDMTVQQLAHRLFEDEVGGYPVVDGDGRLVGIVTETDLIFMQKQVHIPTTFAFLDAVITLGGGHRFEEELRRLAARTVGDVMTREVVWVAADAPIEKVASLMVEHRLYTIPVVEEGRVVGVIGRRDMVRAFLHGTREGDAAGA